MHLTEHWKDITGYEGMYHISDHGRVRSLQRIDPRGRKCGGELRALDIHYKGHIMLRLFKSGDHKKFFVHRLVAKAFIPNPENLPLVNHIDSNKQNNHISNLEWCTEKYNTQHYYQAKREREAHTMPVESEEIAPEDIPF